MTDENILMQCQADASHALCGVECLSEWPAGIETTLAKLIAITAGDRRVRLTSTEAAMLSWSLGVCTYLLVAAKAQERICDKAMQKQMLQPTKSKGNGAKKPRTPNRRKPTR